MSSAPPALARATALDRLHEPRACSPTYPRSKPSPGRPIRPSPVVRHRTSLAAGALRRRQLRPKSSRPSDLNQTVTIRSIQSQNIQYRSTLVLFAKETLGFMQINPRSMLGEKNLQTSPFFYGLTPLLFQNRTRSPAYVFLRASP